MPKPRTYQIPDFLVSMGVKQLIYERWLHWRAVAHVKRDKKRGNKTATTKAYKRAIHVAVQSCGGKDHYTGEELNWSLLSKYNNEESKAQGRHYKAKFALLPSVDHVRDGLGEAAFKICAWQTNDAKSDLSHDDFVALCRRVVAHFDKLSA